MILSDLHCLFVLITKIILMGIGLMIIWILNVIEIIVSTIFDLLEENAHHVFYLSVLIWILFYFYGDTLQNIWNNLFQ
jgi:hypothetical protein